MLDFLCIRVLRGYLGLSFGGDRSAPPAPRPRARAFEFCEPLERRQLLSAAVGSVAAPLLASAPAVQASLKAKKTVKRTAADGYSGPIVIDQGGVYSGAWQSLSAGTPAIRVTTDEPVIIENSLIRGRGILIEVIANRAKLTIRNNRGYGMNPNVYGRYPGRFIDVDGLSRAVIENNYLENTGGIYLAGYRGNRSANQTVKIIGNQAMNIEGRMSNGRGGWLNATPAVGKETQFVQLNGLHGLTGAEIAWNQVINLPGKSRVQDNISIHDSSGKRTSPIRIHDNYVQGAYPAGSADGRNYFGGGIMVSDNGANYVHAYNNHVVATGHIGIAISSGHDNKFYSNRIVSDGRVPAGGKMRYSNVGAAVFNYNGDAQFGRNVGYNNMIGWIGAAGRNDAWTLEGSKVLRNNKKLKVTKNAEAAEWQIWQQKIAANGVQVGTVGF